MRVNAILHFIEEKGNRLPSPTMLFVWLCGWALIASAAGAWLSLSAVHPVTQIEIHAVNLLSREGIHKILTHTVSNFMGFAPVGTVLVAMLGLGVAEHSGLLAAALKGSILRAPKQLLSFFVVLCGVLSSLAADTGYVVLIPLAALIFYSLGRNPLLGIAAAFAGVSGGFSANLLISPFDAVLSGLSTEAAQLVDADYQVSPASNYFFLVVSTFFISLVGALITEKIIAPMLEKNLTENTPVDKHALTLSLEDKRGLKACGLFTLLFVGLLLLGLLPENGVLKDGANGSILQSPFLTGVVTVIAFYAMVAGVIFGRVSGRYQKASDGIAGMEQHMATMASYLVLMFFAAQFVSYFSWSGLGNILAISGASFLSGLDLPVNVILILFVLLTAAINIFIGSGSGKWALIAPIFIPMLLLIGIAPEATQMAYRIGDSTTNIISPLMPYFGVVVAFAQKYDNKAGMGTIVAMMLPYSVIFLLGWSVLLTAWLALGWPLGV